MILLGLGEDGHTASLFPGGAAVREKKRLVAAEYAAKPGSARLTLTLPFINQAKNILFLIEGRRKKKAFAALLSGKMDVPAARVLPRGNLTILLDEAVIK